MLSLLDNSAEITKRAILKCKHLDERLQVYDQIVFDGKVELPSGLDEIAPFKTPISVKDIERWE